MFFRLPQLQTVPYLFYSVEEQKVLEDFLENNFDHFENLKQEIDINIKEETTEVDNDFKDDHETVLEEGLKKLKKKCDKKLFKCDLCGKTFNRPKKLIWHMESHSGKEFRCDVCNKTFKNSRGLAAHMKVIHEGKVKQRCGKGWWSIK